MRRRLRESKKIDLKSLVSNLDTWHYIGLAVFAVVLIFSIFLFWISRDLPSLTQLEHFEPRLVTKVLSADSVVIKEFYTQRRDYVFLDNIPIQMQQAIISIEDRKFYRHWGFDLKRFVKAAFVDITHLAIKEGASTITQQLTTDLYYNKREKWLRKIREILTAIQIERTYSKPEILEMYLNHIYFGHGNYGLKSASEFFFNKNPDELSLEECALLAGVINLPEYYSPIRHPDRALRRRNLVLYVMYKNGFISEDRYRQTAEKPIVLGEGQNRKETDIAPYFTEYIRQKLYDQYGSELFTGGYTIYTTLNTKMQKYAEKAGKEQLARLQENINRRYENEEKFKQLLKKYVTDPEEKKYILSNPAARDSLINTKAAVQIAFVAVDPTNGHILAMIGGRDFSESKWNRAVQMKRQPGSSFKPFIYTAVVDNGYPPTYEILNQPVVLFLPNGERWIPRNFDRDQGGPTTLREAITKSLNLVSARILMDIVQPSVVVNYAHRMGITTNLRPVDALALGTSEVIPLEITSAYGIFANKGIYVHPIAITEVLNRQNEVIYDAFPERKEVLSDKTSYIMTSLLESVINHGTGVTARTVYNFTRPAGGKTGTTDEFTDAWFVGFTPQISTGVWVGLDDPYLSLGHNQTGAVAALPIWANFMKAAHDSLHLPVADFTMPDGIVKLQICKQSKQIATQYCPQVIEEVFKEETAPTQKCQIHTGKIEVNKTDSNKKKRVIF